MSQINKLVWSPSSTPEELHPMLDILGGEYPIFDSGRGLKLEFKKVKKVDSYCKVSRGAGKVLIEYSTVAAAARGVGSAMAKIETEESTSFQTLGIMLDVSRNMVMKVDHLQMWFRRLVLSGYNMIMLYTEDTYQLPDEPFFGRLRGAYSADEIRELDDYAHALGIELVGCIQTLGHLEQILRWDAYGNTIRDTASVVMVEEPKTYALVQKMIAFWSENLRSRRIHIGMDETHDLGRGRYMDKHGFKSPFELFNGHLSKVNEICKEHKLTPMIWSDMYFRLSNPEQNYYDLENPIPKSVQDKIPKNVQLVYWDYYHTDGSFYEGMIKRHRDIGFEPVMASGIWTWTKLWYDHQKTVETVVPGIKSCRKQKVKELFFTMWGDDGAYCNYDSSLAGLVYAADLAFGADENDSKNTAKRFEAICMSDYDAHILASGINYYIKDYMVNPAMLIWDDPMYGIAYREGMVRDSEFDLKLVDTYEEILKKLLPRLEDVEAGNFTHVINILDAAIKKVELRGALLYAYATDDRVALRQIAVTMIPAVAAAVAEFDASFRQQWLDCAKPFGLETIQIRNAGVIARLEETALRIQEYLAGDILEIEEIEESMLDSSQTNGFNWYMRIFSGCFRW